MAQFSASDAEAVWDHHFTIRKGNRHMTRLGTLAVHLAHQVLWFGSAKITRDRVANLLGLKADYAARKVLRDLYAMGIFERNEEVLRDGPNHLRTQVTLTASERMGDFMEFLAEHGLRKTVVWEPYGKPMAKWFPEDSGTAQTTAYGQAFIDSDRKLFVQLARLGAGREIVLVSERELAKLCEIPRPAVQRARDRLEHNWWLYYKVSDAGASQWAVVLDEEHRERLLAGVLQAGDITEADYARLVPIHLRQNDPLAPKTDPLAPKADPLAPKADPRAPREFNRNLEDPKSEEGQAPCPLRGGSQENDGARDKELAAQDQELAASGLGAGEQAASDEEGCPGIGVDSARYKALAQSSDLTMNEEVGKLVLEIRPELIWPEKYRGAGSIQLVQWLGLDTDEMRQAWRKGRIREWLDENVRQALLDAEMFEGDFEQGTRVGTRYEVRLAQLLSELAPEVTFDVKDPRAPHHFADRVGIKERDLRWRLGYVGDQVSRAWFVRELLPKIQARYARRKPISQDKAEIPA